jgi:hypothetical protein
LRVARYIRQHHIGFVALFVALTGTAYAGTQVASHQANPQASQAKKKKKKKIKRGPAGPPGAAGSPAASMLTGAFPDQNSASAPSFNSPSGRTDVYYATAAAAAMLSPATTVVARDLFVRRTANSDLTRTTTLNVNGSDTVLTCTITPGTASCSDTTHAVSIPPGSSLALHYVNDGSGGGNLPDVQFGWRATTP